MNQLNAIICIPDMTGFTRFIANTDDDIAAEIISKLLKGLVESNELNYSLAEIEGDAVLFYHVGKQLSFKDIINQCKRFYLDFGKTLKSLEEQYLPAEIHELRSLYNLGLKIILHYGNISYTKIDDKIKVIGRDIVKAHLLLKNNIGKEEYILMSEEFLSLFESAEIKAVLNWSIPENGKVHYEDVGEMKYKYVDLRPLLKSIATGES